MSAAQRTARQPSQGGDGPTVVRASSVRASSITRRGLLAGGVGAAAALGLAACGSATSSATASAATRRQVSTLHGKVSVPASPKRVVAVDFPEVCSLIDLGIIPVARTNYVPAFPAYDAALKGLPKIDDGTSLTLEKIAALKPDLIVGDDWKKASQQRIPYAKLRAIAPTALFEWKEAAGNWPELAARTAATVGRTSKLKSLQRSYAAAASAIDKKYAHLLSTTRWDLIDGGTSGWDLYSAASSHGRVAHDAGIRLGAGAKQTAGFVSYSLEKLGMLRDTDVIVLPAASEKALRSNALFQSLPAVKAGRVYTTELFFPASYGIANGLLRALKGFCADVKGTI